MFAKSTFAVLGFFCIASPFAAQQMIMFVFHMSSAPSFLACVAHLDSNKEVQACLCSFFCL